LTTVDIVNRTSKQRDTAVVAVSEGYYESPRQADLNDLTESLPISKSALSKRLTAVETKLTTAVFDPE
jgi:predicted DNA binding protein